MLPYRLRKNITGCECTEWAKKVSNNMLEHHIDLLTSIAVARAAIPYHTMFFTPLIYRLVVVMAIQ